LDSTSARVEYDLVVYNLPVHSQMSNNANYEDDDDNDNDDDDVNDDDDDTDDTDHKHDNNDNDNNTLITLYRTFLRRLGKR
jgi:hypothetical protein